MSERRQARITAALGIIVEHGDSSTPAMTRNLSSGGLFFPTRTPPPVGSPVVVTLLHGSIRLKTRARVVNVTGDGAGIEFREVSEAFERGIKLLLRELSHGDGPDPNEAAAPHGRTLSWSYAPKGFSIKNLWRLRQRKVPVSNVSADGAVLHVARRPPVGELLLVYVGSGKSRAHCRAVVARHTKLGFAVRFLAPRREFQQAITKLRKGLP